MSELITQATPELFQKAASGDAASMATLTGMFQATSQNRVLLPTAVRNMVQVGMNAIAAKLTHELTDEQAALLKEALACGIDTAALRPHYADLATRDFANAANPALFVGFVGIRDISIPILNVLRRWHILQTAQAGVYFCDQAGNAGVINAVNENAFEVTINNKTQKKITIPLFISTCMVVKTGTVLEELMKGKKPEATGVSRRKEFEDSLLRACSLPSNFLQKLLVPHFMNANLFNAAVMGTAPAAVQAPAEESPATTAAPAQDIRWDDSRSVLELSERLKNLDSLSLPDAPHLDNVLHILQEGAVKIEQAENFAMALAYLNKMGDPEIKKWLAETAASLEITAAAWQSMTLCAEICDKIPGKLAPFWMEMIQKAKGSAFLAGLCLSLPYRLWTPIGKILNAAGDRTVLADKVTAHLSANKATADMLYWLWRSNLDASIKDKFLSDSTLLFKTLHQEAKGDYLKAQRDLKKLLLEDTDFQQQVMLRGDHMAVVELIRCIKHLPLLDAGEIQSILVKINNLYPEYISDIEEKRKGPVKYNFGKLTSIRSYNRYKAELDDIINVQIPANSKALEEARSHGDMRENSEFKYAKERQGFLNSRMREYQNNLNGLRTTDFTEVQVSNVVIPGCSVTIRYRDDNREETFHILGMLDSWSEKGIISYTTPMGRALVGKEIGTRFTMPMGDKATIVAIQPLSPELMDYVAGRGDLA